MVAIPRAAKPEHAAVNLDALSFELTAQDMADISRLFTDGGRLVDPEWAPEWD